MATGQAMYREKRKETRVGTLQPYHKQNLTVNRRRKWHNEHKTYSVRRKKGRNARGKQREESEAALTGHIRRPLN